VRRLYLGSEGRVGGRGALPDDAVESVEAAHGLLVDDGVELVLERVAAADAAEERHKLDRVLSHVERLYHQRRRRHVVRAQRLYPVPTVACK